MQTTNSEIQQIQKQQTFVMIKPDGVLRGLTGEILQRFEKRGLKVVGMKLTKATQEMLEKHYPASRKDWVERLGVKGKEAFMSVGEDLTANSEYSDYKMGQEVLQYLLEYMKSGPVLCFVLEGIQAVSVVRKMVGSTLPTLAEIGTIRGDYSIDFPIVGLSQKRALHNLIHASENIEEAKYEIDLWFKKEEILDYKLGLEDIMVNRFY
jgi:nucleoside-diphosphate kinase